MFEERQAQERPAPGDEAARALHVMNIDGQGLQTSGLR
jgi:hypothetical protein